MVINSDIKLCPSSCTLWAAQPLTSLMYLDKQTCCQTPGEPLCRGPALRPHLQLRDAEQPCREIWSVEFAKWSFLPAKTDTAWLWGADTAWFSCLQGLPTCCRPGDQKAAPGRTVNAQHAGQQARRMRVFYGSFWCVRAAHRDSPSPFWTLSVRSQVLLFLILMEP